MDGEKGSAVLLKKALADNYKYLEILLEDAFPVLCVNGETRKQRTMSFKALHSNNSHFWQVSGTWSYYLAGDVLAALEGEEKKRAAQNSFVPAGTAEQEPKPAVKPEAEPAAEKTPETGFGGEYEAIQSMTGAERLERLGENKTRLDSLIAEKVKDQEAVTEALVTTTQDTALVNRAALLEAVHLADDEAKKSTQQLVDSTQDLVRSSTLLITADIFNDELMNTLVAKSNGTVIQHMTRVFLNGLAFLSYYNELLNKSSIISKLRVTFEKTYRDFYRRLLPHMSPGDITLERIFLKGMRAIPEQEFVNWATGFLIHDIGKASAVEYHEGESAYNRDIVVEHVKVGYTSVMHKTNYSRDAGLITGYHHEYYGDSGGYGYFRTGLEQYKKNNPGAEQAHCISYEPGPVQRYQTLGFFPAKVLEIIDVYDSVTDPNRKYRKAMNCEEALSMMREEFIEKHLKIDPILFDIFAGFIRKKSGL